MRKTLIASLLMVVGILSCSGPTEPTPISSISIAASSTTIASGATLQLTAATLGKDGKALTNRVVTWSSSNTNIATVSATGLVTAGYVLGGTNEPVTITAAAEEVTGTVAVAVAPSPVTTISLTPATGTTVVGATLQLTVTLKDAGGNTLTGRTVSWSASDTTVVLVSTSGLVSTKSYLGAATRTSAIIATSETKTASTNVSVTPIPVHRISLNTDSITLLVGDTTAVTARFFSQQNQELTGRQATLISTNTAIAQTHQSQRVTGNGIGTTNVIVTSGEAADTIAVDVVKWLSLAAGGEHTCAISSRQVAYCWGWNSTGQVGNSETSDVIKPTKVNTQVLFSSIAAGTNHTCGISTTGKVYCWGANTYGQLGDSSVNQKTSPTQVVTSIVFKHISAGETHTCGLSADSVAYCWGNNTSGELGINNQTSSTVVRRVLFSESQKIISIEARNQHTCAILYGGQAYCWGLNSYASLGLGTDFHGNRTAPALVATETRFAMLMPRGHWHSCAMGSTGYAECWGLNWLGALGNPSAGNQLVTPLPIQGGHNWQSLAGGGGHLVGGRNHTCGVTTTESLYCWGDNSFGQGGEGFQSNLEPVKLNHEATFRVVVAGAGHTCALTDVGQTYCTGRNEKGSLGIGNRDMQRTLQRVRLH